MEKSRLGKFIDNLAITLAIFFLLFFLLRQFIRNFILAFSLSVALTFFILYFIISYQNKKYERLSIKKSELGLTQKYNRELRKMEKREQLDFFKALLSSHKVEQKKDGLLIDNETYFFLCLFKDELTESDIYEAYVSSKKLKADEIIIVCNGYNPSLSTLISSFDKPISVFTPLETFALMKKYECFPIIAEEHEEKRKAPLIFSGLNRKRAWVFIRIGILLDILAFFVPFAKYYIIVGAVNLILGIICLLFGKRMPTAKNVNKLLK